jgi:hypothetical protein
MRARAKHDHAVGRSVNPQIGAFACLGALVGRIRGLSRNLIANLNCVAMLFATPRARARGRELSCHARELTG